MNRATPFILAAIFVGDGFAAVVVERCSKADEAATRPRVIDVDDEGDSLFTREYDRDLERIRLWQGAIRVKVATPAASDAHVLVRAPDGEVEARATDFHVLVRAERIERVEVERGRVSLRRGESKIDLESGQIWTRPAKSASER